MKITQEVRDFAAGRAANGELLGATRYPEPRQLAEGQAAESDFAAKQNAPAVTFIAATGEADAEAGMAEMSEVFKAKGGKIYLPAAK